MTTRYTGVFSPDRKVISKSSLQDFVGIPYIEHIFKEEFHHEFKKLNGYMAQYPIFSAINLDGTKKILKAGNFEIIDIGPDEGTKNFEGRNIKIAENDGQKIHTHRSTIPSYYFIEKDLIPLIDILTITGNWDIFCDLQKLKASEKLVERLKETIKKQTLEIETLKGEIEKSKLPPN